MVAFPFLKTMESVLQIGSSYLPNSNDAIFHRLTSRTSYRKSFYLILTSDSTFFDLSQFSPSPVFPYPFLVLHFLQEYELEMLHCFYSERKISNGKWCLWFQVVRFVVLYQKSFKFLYTYCESFVLLKLNVIRTSSCGDSLPLPSYLRTTDYLAICQNVNGEGGDDGVSWSGKSWWKISNWWDRKTSVCPWELKQCPIHLAICVLQDT